MTRGVLSRDLNRFNSRPTCLRSGEYRRVHASRNVDAILVGVECSLPLASRLDISSSSPWPNIHQFGRGSYILTARASPFLGGALPVALVHRLPRHRRKRSRRISSNFLQQICTRCGRHCSLLSFSHERRLSNSPYRPSVHSAIVIG